MFRVKALEVEGCYLITPTVFMENTCDLIRVFNDTQFNIYGLSTDFKEEYYAIARPGVVRGMHYQAPPEEQDKIITCIAGEIQDVVIDLRKKSKTYGRYVVVELNEFNRDLIYVPKGCAHGYYIKGNKDALIFYKVTKPFNNDHRGGVNWDSLNIPWEFNKDEVTVEEWDNKLAKFEEFDSPF
ncbi:dTDP-4-dehydrorhamnose 3,5-epimerase family protein [Clostridium gasigenes]|uniref:dTDP-4-dehydrorhamnose 3,5-epimerase n=1 Tax=Clostridium gasigenes TaxID=94869 RepID=A0A1H0QLZ1_9CLOT|nr:dTDP-4-dehydrorhamnose 3,5-epimerase family protein [Clostridium gasigenes]MBB6624573.1 dTDP-4-dehydrorhamnose 3,5-epimerase family protein [Clostridium gasigenes]SDP18344.1 dTDP-4-dehydrorhamnose 3,5-epimerase [Clostridium gasigenes]